jgi:HD-GYP domain-containing protein (c-di-GMP phosphodiesterase class II)
MRMAARRATVGGLYHGLLMLKKIQIGQVRRGMYIQRLEGSWLTHSLWRTKFLLDDDADIIKLRESGAAELWIDIEQGLDVFADLADQTTAPVVETGSNEAPGIPAARRPTTQSEELAKAVEIRDRARVVVTSMFSEARLGKMIDPEVCAPLVADVVDSVHRNSDALVSLSRLKIADEYTYLHSVAVCALMVSLGRQLGMDDAQCHEAGMAGLMHDLGKAAMPMEIINKPGKLTDDEFAIIRQHPERGHQMLLEGGVTNASVLGVCRSHHERIDGKGYPDALMAGTLPLIVRMGAVCDVYDAITSNRPYKAGWDPAESIARMASWKGHFDEEVLRAFIRSLGIYPTGSLVRLSSGRLGVVTAQNPQKLTAPRVKVIFSTNTMTQIKAEVLDLAASGCGEQILGREQPERWPMLPVNELWQE